MITIRQRLRRGKRKGATKRIHSRVYKKGRATLKKRLDHTLCMQKLVEQSGISYNLGFDAGYDDALSKSVEPESREIHQEILEKEYKKGLYDGGEGIVDTILPDIDLLPEITVKQIIIAGVEQMRSQYYRVLSATEVARQIMTAVENRVPLSIVRLGDGELLTLAQDVVMNQEQVRKEGKFLNYAGIHIPDLAARDQLVQAIRFADIVGIPKIRLPNFQPLAFAVFKAHGIDYRQLRLTLSTINYALYLEGFFRNLLANRRVLVVGNSSPGLSQVLTNSGIQVTGAIYPVAGVRDIPRVMSEISAHQFDIALVAAGVPAVIIVQRIAYELGKVAIDFGHLADSFVTGEAVL